MKRLNISMAFILCVFTQCTKAQNINYLTENQCSNITINSVKWDDIDKTEGNLYKMQKLMKMPFKKSIETEPNNIIYLDNKDNGLLFHFEGDGGRFQLFGFIIEKRGVTFTILDKTVQIGDYISRLGNIKTKMFDGIKEVCFSVYDNNITIYFNNDKITKIEYETYY